MRIRNCQRRTAVSRIGPAIAFCLLAVGCASSDRIRLADVVVIEKGASPIDASQGSRDRALNRLRRTAAKRGGTAIAVRVETEMVCTDCHGSVVEVRADGIRCPR